MDVSTSSRPKRRWRGRKGGGGGGNQDNNSHGGDSDDDDDDEESSLEAPPSVGVVVDDLSMDDDTYDDEQQSSPKQQQQQRQRPRKGKRRVFGGLEGAFLIKRKAAAAAEAEAAADRDRGALSDSSHSGRGTGAGTRGGRRRNNNKSSDTATGAGNESAGTALRRRFLNPLNKLKHTITARSAAGGAGAHSDDEGDPRRPAKAITFAHSFPSDGEFDLDTLGRDRISLQDSEHTGAAYRSRHSSADDHGGPPRTVAFEMDGMDSDSDGPGGTLDGGIISPPNQTIIDFTSYPPPGGIVDYTCYQHNQEQPPPLPPSYAAAQAHHPGERARYSIYSGAGARQKKRKFRVRPYHCFPEAVQMTEEEIYADSLLSSKKFEPIKSYLKYCSKITKKMEVSPAVKKLFGTPNEDGRIGAIRLEVLGCISLPRQKPDICVYLVCGDNAFCTDVVSGYRSPMWPAASKRACVFPLHHAYARIFVGVFDVRVRTNKDTDVFCGRVPLDVSVLRPDTEYDITFPLRASTFVYDRKARGVIRMRFSLHWFSERAAVYSYFKSPKSLSRSSPLYEGQPSIPCADPKTFRNVAITVHGQDFPGKYSRSAFRATMREFNLYRQNLIHMVKNLVLDAVLYERPHISLYLFVAGMYSVWHNAFWMIPPIFVGYILILYLENYRHYVTKTEFNLGYRQLTLTEIAKGLLYDPLTNEPSFQPIVVQKRTKRRKNKNRAAAAQKMRQLSAAVGEGGDAGDEKEVEVVPLDHREFPWSERDAYPKFSIEHALAPSTKGGNRRGSTTALHGRLSVYYSAAPPSMADHMENENKEDDDNYSDSGNDSDNETVMTESGLGDDDMFNMDIEPDDEEGSDDGTVATNKENSEKTKKQKSIFGKGEKSAKRRIRLGPPQNTDTKSANRVPPQVHLKRIECILHKLSLGISVELVHPPVELERALTSIQPEETTNEKETNEKDKKGKKSKKDKDKDKTGLEELADTAKKKVPKDEFDRVLGLQATSANPMTRIASTFLGPLMRMIRIFLFACRIAYNISSWRDPYISFWVFCVLAVWTFVLSVFPWRKFFFFATSGLFGPQNLAIRRYLEKKEAKKEAERLAKEAMENATAEAEAAANADEYGYGDAAPDMQNRNADDPYGYGNASPDVQAKMSDKDKKREETQKASLTANLTTNLTTNLDAKLNFFQRKLQQKRKKFLKALLDDPDITELVDRPSFQSETQGGLTSSASRKYRSRAVAVPYSRVRKDRFFDWPPDPTVSRATPLYAIVGEAAAAAKMHRSGVSVAADDYYDDSTIEGDNTLGGSYSYGDDNSLSGGGGGGGGGGFQMDNIGGGGGAGFQMDNIGGGGFQMDNIGGGGGFQMDNIGGGGFQMDNIGTAPPGGRRNRNRGMMQQNNNNNNVPDPAVASHLPEGWRDQIHDFVG